MRNYCSLFDSRYAPQGLALYESLWRHSSEPFKLWVLPMDSKCQAMLEAVVAPSMIVLDPQRFERTMRLHQIKTSRTWQEWAWTCASQLCEYLMRMGLPELTYLDADLFMFSDPESVFDFIGEPSIAITPHQFIPSKQHLEVNGRFNVGWVSFRNTPAGRDCVEHWARQCRERCSAEVGCGDQRYLDSWETDYRDDLCTIEDIRVNVGPWSLSNWQVTEGPMLDELPLIAYHFHETRFRDDGTVHLTNYVLRPEDIERIYTPYIAEVQKQKERIESLHLQAV